MDILIRNVPPDIVKVIEQKAKKAGVSRQSYLLTQICRMSQTDSFTQERNRYSTLMKDIGKIIENQAREISGLSDKIDMLNERI